MLVIHGGPARIVHKDYGVKVSLGDDWHLIKEFKRKLERFVMNPVIMQQLGENASPHVFKYYSWEAKA